MPRKTNYILIFFLFFGNIPMCFSSEILTTEKMYIKEYDAQGNLMAEGWKVRHRKIDYWIFYYQNGAVASKGHFSSNQKDGYWYFYNESGQKIKEGHFENGSSENWWIFYDLAKNNKSKFQFKNNQKNGFALRYTNNRLVKVEEYQSAKKMNEWTSIIAFKIDNPTVSLK